MIESRQLGAFKKSPFGGLRTYPIIYEFRVQYGDRRGRWFVRTFEGATSFDWVWSDDHGRSDLPRPRAGAIVDNDVIPIGYLTSAIQVISLILLGLIGVFVLFWFFF